MLAIVKLPIPILFVNFIHFNFTTLNRHSYILYSFALEILNNTKGFHAINLQCDHYVMLHSFIMNSDEAWNMSDDEWYMKLPGFEYLNTYYITQRAFMPL